MDTTNTTIVEGRPSGVGATEEAARARQRETDHGEQLDGGSGGYWMRVGMLGTMSEEVVGGGGERQVALADPDARLKQGDATKVDEFTESDVNSMGMT